MWRDLIGYYGDKEWFEWLVENIDNGSGSIIWGTNDFTLMCNHDLRRVSINEWFEAHKSQTQEEWIRDGFREYGLSVHIPPTDEDTMPLLELLGRSVNGRIEYMLQPDGSRDATSLVPNYVQYNAFRWLRDAKFWWDQLYPLGDKGASLSAEARLGFAVYKGYEARFPPWESPGRLSFAEPYHRIGTEAPPPRMSAWSRYEVPMLFIAIALLSTGSLLVAATLLRRRGRAAGTVGPAGGDGRGL